MKVICNLCGKAWIDYDSNSEKVWLYHECEIINDMCNTPNYKLKITVKR